MHDIIFKWIGLDAFINNNMRAFDNNVIAGHIVTDPYHDH